MNCPYCGSEILDNSKFCPDCGENLEKIVIEEIPLEKAFEDKLYSYLKGYKRSAFTVESLVERLEEIVKDPKERVFYGR